jgi:hypothetical protein
MWFIPLPQLTLPSPMQPHLSLPVDVGGAGSVGGCSWWWDGNQVAVSDTPPFSGPNPSVRIDFDDDVSPLDVLDYFLPDDEFWHRVKEQTNLYARQRKRDVEVDSQEGW